MHYLLVNLYQDHPGQTFDPDCVVQRLEDAFPEIDIDPEDQLLARARDAEKVLNAGTPAEQAVLTKLKRDAREQGPARAFSLVLDGQKIRGVVKRHLLQMTYEAPLRDESLNQLKSFIRSLLPPGENIAIEEES